MPQPERRSSAPIDIVVVAETRNPHGEVVRDELRVLGASSFVYNLANFRQQHVRFQSGLLEVEVGGDWVAISNRTGVWWHRTGEVDVGDLDEDEALLAGQEALSLFRGTLTAAGVRWWDDPFVVDRADMKPFQLSVVSNLGVAIPATLVTNHVEEARAFAKSRQIVAKASSAGIGIAPYVDFVTSDDLRHVGGLPVMLQEFVPASADLRVVVVGKSCWVWRRPREDDVIDWRQVDPTGSAFARVERPILCESAVEITSALGLSMSVQDWLETPESDTFLECNAQGGWIFLDGSRNVVAPCLARHLLSR